MRNGADVRVAKSELQAAGKLIPLKEFMSATQSIYQTPSLAWRIAKFVVGKPLWWAMEKLSIVGGEEATIKNDGSLWKKISGPYISLDNLEVCTHEPRLMAHHELISFSRPLQMLSSNIGEITALTHSQTPCITRKHLLRSTAKLPFPTSP